MKRCVLVLGITFSVLGCVGSKPGDTNAGACSAENRSACDMQLLMKTQLGPELKRHELEELAASLKLVAALAPEGFADWKAIARDGAVAAEKQDLDGARKSCGHCHDLYRKRFKTEVHPRTIARAQEKP